ncbi:unnamed protein product [Ectocarpus sp. CCAP 1310/34]|nr:unnamed protein product [Ectocarpus sp. CCAP 1310/34]
MAPERPTYRHWLTSPHHDINATNESWGATKTAHAANESWGATPCPPVLGAAAHLSVTVSTTPVPEASAFCFSLRKVKPKGRYSEFHGRTTAHAVVR